MSVVEAHPAEAWIDVGQSFKEGEHAWITVLIGGDGYGFMPSDTAIYAIHVDCLVDVVKSAKPADRLVRDVRSCLDEHEWIITVDKTNALQAKLTP